MIGKMDASIRVRVTPKEKADLKRVAEGRGLTESKYLRMLLFDIDGQVNKVPFDAFIKTGITGDALTEWARARIDESMKKEVVSAADEAYVSLSEYVRLLIREDVEAYDEAEREGSEI